MLSSRWIRQSLCLIMLAVCLLIPEEVKAAGTLVLEAAPLSADGLTDVSVSYSGMPELGAADLIIELTGDIRTRTDSGEIGTDPDNSSWVREGDAVYISMISHGGFTGVLAEIPVQVGPQGGTIRLMLDRAYDLLPFNITEEVEIRNALLTYEGERIPEEPAATVTSAEAAAEPDTQAQTETAVTETSSAVTTAEVSAAATPAETAPETVSTETEAGTVSGPAMTETESLAVIENITATTAAEEPAGAVPTEDVTENNTADTTSLNESATGVQPSETMIESSMPSLTDEQTETETSVTAGGGVTSPGADNPAAAEQADVESGTFTQTFNRVLRVLIAILLIAVLAGMIILTVSARRRR